MKRKLLLLFVCLFGALNGVKAWTSAAPQVGRAYYLYHVELGQFFRAVGEGHPFYLTADLAQATPVVVESGWKFRFYVNGTAYKLYHEDGTASLNTNGVDFKLYESEPSNGYQIYTGDKGTFSDSRRWFYATEEGGSCYFPITKNKSGDIHWKFVPTAEVCASAAEANYVSGWTRVTSVDMLKTNPEDYFFAIFSADAAGLIVDASSSNAEPTRPYYKTAANPLSSSQYLFEIENYESDGFALKSCALNKYFGNNGDSWNFQNLTKKESNCKLTITLNNGAFLIQSANADWEGRRYWGLYDYTGYTNGQKFAGNKNDAEKGSFLIYRIAKEGLNMTSRIKDPNLDSNLDDWQKTSEGGNGIVAASGGAESWNSSNFNFYQTLTNLPNGYYEIGVRAFYRAGNKRTTGAERNVKLYAKTEEVAVKNINQYQASTPGAGIWVQPDGASYYVPDNTEAANYALNTLNAYNNSVVAHVTDGTLTFGVKKETPIANDWSYWDTFTLTYLGENHVIIDDPETKTQTYEGTFTEDVDFTPTAECPIVDITGASFTGNIDVSFAENPNGLIIATSAQKIDLNYLKEEPVKNIISTKDNLSDKVIITDGYPFVAPFDFQAQEARYSRTVGASTNFGTICVPFALTSNDDIQYYTTDQITGGVLKLTEVNNVAAGTPAIFKKKNSGATSISVHKIGTAIEKDAGSQGENVRLVGKFERYVVGDEGGTTGTAANGNYFISSDVFYEGADYIIVKPFRAYLETVGVIQSRLTLQIDDEATAINELKTLDEKQGLKDGKYLIGGKIIVVKEGQQFNVNGVINK